MRPRLSQLQATNGKNEGGGREKGIEQADAYSSSSPAARSSTVGCLATSPASAAGAPSAGVSVVGSGSLAAMRMIGVSSWSAVAETISDLAISIRRRGWILRQAW